MGFLSDDELDLDETTVTMENVTSERLCNLSALMHEHSSNPYIPAWYLQVRLSLRHRHHRRRRRRCRRIIFVVRLLHDEFCAFHNLSVVEFFYVFYVQGFKRHQMTNGK